MTQKRTHLIPWHTIRPVGGRVKVALEPQEKLSDIIEIVNNEQNEEKYTREHGIIMEIGEGAFGPSTPNPDDKIKAGDMAIFKKYAGHGFERKDDGTVIRVMNDTEIWAYIPKEELDKVGYDASYSISEGSKQLMDLINYHETERLKRG